MFLFHVDTTQIESKKLMNVLIEKKIQFKFILNKKSSNIDFVF